VNQIPGDVEEFFQPFLAEFLSRWKITKVVPEIGGNNSDQCALKNSMLSQKRLRGVFVQNFGNRRISMCPTWFKAPARQNRLFCKCLTGYPVPGNIFTVRNLEMRAELNFQKLSPFVIPPSFLPRLLFERQLCFLREPFFFGGARGPRRHARLSFLAALGELFDQPLPRQFPILELRPALGGYHDDSRRQMLDPNGRFGFILVLPAGPAGFEGGDFDLAFQGRNRKRGFSKLVGF
jgi:hypothetical protein